MPLDEESAVNLLKHLTFVEAHSGKGAAGRHRGDDDGGPFCADPEAGRRRFGYKLKYLGHHYEARRSELLTEGPHQIIVPLPREIQYASEMLHD